MPRDSHPNSLANLRPIRPGQVLNPTGRNGATQDRERRERFLAVCRVLNRTTNPELEELLLEKLAEVAYGGALAGDRRLVSLILAHELQAPTPEPEPVYREDPREELSRRLDALAAKSAETLVELRGFEPLTLRLPVSRKGQKRR